MRIASCRILGSRFRGLRFHRHRDFPMILQGCGDLTVYWQHVSPISALSRIWELCEVSCSGTISHRFWELFVTMRRIACMFLSNNETQEHPQRGTSSQFFKAQRRLPVLRTDRLDRPGRMIPFYNAKPGMRSHSSCEWC